MALRSRGFALAARPGAGYERTMNMNRPTQPAADLRSPPLAIYAAAKPLHREPPPLWTSSLTSKPVWSGRESDLLRPRNDREKPLFPTINLLLGTWDPARHPLFRVGRDDPLHREAKPIRREVSPSSPAPASPPVSSSAKAADPRLLRLQAPNKGERPRPPAKMTRSDNPLHREPAPNTTPGPFRNGNPLRNGNPRGNPNLAPRCGAKTRLGCPCRGPAMKNGRCRMHGGASTGPKTAEGRARIAAAHTIHGGYGAAMRAVQARVSAIVARGWVLQAAVKSGFPMAALAPLLHAVTGTKPGKTRYAVSPPALSPLSLLTFPLTAIQGRRMVRLIRETVVRPDPTRRPRQHPIHREAERSAAVRPSTGLPRVKAIPQSSCPLA